MKTYISKLRTNEDNVAVRSLAVAGIATVAVLGALWATKAGKVAPVVLVVEEAAEVVADATQS